jgi:hypothetical protein
MLHFANSLSIHICARSESERERWAAVFGRLFQNFTRVDGQGGWVGEQFIETEPVAMITCWLPDDWQGVERFVRYAKWYQAAAQQEAVGLQYTAGGRWTGLVVFENDWVEVEDRLLGDLNRAEYLCRFFERTTSTAETIATGSDASDHHNW